MLNCSFSAILMAVLTSNLIIVLIAFCLRHRNVLLSVGYKILIAFMFLTLVRFIFPFELPIVRNVYFPELLSVPITYLRYPLLKLSWISISPWTVFEAIWLAGILYRLRRYLLQHASLRRQIERYSSDITNQEPYAAILAKACGKRKNSFRVLKVYGITTPSIFGIMKPRILIPAKMQLTEENLYYIFCHEISHHYYHDIWIKCFVSFLTVLYWWNPACPVFKKQVDQLLEMRVDGSLVNKDPAIVQSYLRTLLHIRQESNRLLLSTNLSLPENFMLSFLKKENSSALIQRFEMLCCREKKRSHVPLIVLLSVLVISIYLGSYLVTFKTSHMIDQFWTEEQHSNCDVVGEQEPVST